MWCRLVGADLMLVSEVAEPMSRAQALAAVQSALDMLPDGALARQWRAAPVKDDTVFTPTAEGMSLWAAIPISDGQTPGDAARAWLDDWAGQLRSAGMPVNVAQPKRG